MTQSNVYSSFIHHLFLEEAFDILISYDMYSMCIFVIKLIILSGAHKMIFNRKIQFGL